MLIRWLLGALRGVIQEEIQDVLRGKTASWYAAQEEETELPPGEAEEHTRHAILSYIYDQWTENPHDIQTNYVVMFAWADMVRYLDPRLHELLTNWIDEEKKADDLFDAYSCGEFGKAPNEADASYTAFCDQEEVKDEAWGACNEYIESLVDDG